MSSARNTIFALSSGRPPAAIAVVRVSGPQSGAALLALIGRIPEPRRAALARVRDPDSGEVIDEALVLWFPAPKSETGEDVAELQLHGGRAVIAAVLAALGQVAGCRLAEPGEFTRRAFENGRLDLTAVEGLGDLIAADTKAQRRQALRQMQGALAARAEDWRRRLTEALALVEAQIDFSDDGDVPDDLAGAARARAGSMAEEMRALLDDGRRGERLREGLVVAIAGPPNAGKSTLLNWIARRPAAIVSPYPGTTRDVIEVHLDLDGYPVTLLDTAGIRDSSDPVEREGMRRAQERAAAADLVLWVVDTQETHSPPEFPAETWLVLNKIDQFEGGPAGSLPIPGIVRISALKGTGVEEVIEKITAAGARMLSRESSLVTRARHRESLTQCVEALVRASLEDREDLLAEDLRLAARALARLTGRIDVEDVLDVIFRDFCIGK
jgi:tRNA modification GTPase